MVNGRTEAEDMAARHEERNGEPPQMPRWIPVAERLPDCGTWCWVWWAGLSHPFAAMRDKRAIGGWRNDGWEDWRKEVSHWMPMPPLPSPPEAKS